MGDGCHLDASMGAGVVPWRSSARAAAMASGGAPRARGAGKEMSGMGGEVRGTCRSWGWAPSEEDWSRDWKEVVPARSDLGVGRAFFARSYRQVWNR
jgi:hypothetical protein